MVSWEALEFSWEAETHTFLDSDAAFRGLRQLPRRQSGAFGPHMGVPIGVPWRRVVGRVADLERERESNEPEPLT